MTYVSHQHGLIGVPVRADLMNIFPDAKRVSFLGDDLMLLPWEFDVCKLLKNLGIKVPPRVTGEYNFVGGKPYEVQRKTVELLTSNHRAYVLNDLGTGKTKSAVWAFDYLRNKGQARRMLVAAKLSTLKFTWAREVFETAPHLSCAVLHGTAERRKKLLAEKHDVYVINHDGVQVIDKELLARTDIDTLVIDELAAYRSGKGPRWKVMQALCARMKWAWGMTGAPTPNSPTDAWAQARLLTPATVPQFFGRFREKVQIKAAAFKWVNKQNHAQEVFKALSPAVRYSLDDVVELPELIERTIDVGMGAKQKMIYDKLRTQASVLVEGGDITAANAAGILTKLLQISMGYVYTSDRTVYELDATERMNTLVDLIDSTSRKVLVFSPYTHVVAGIAKRLTTEKMDFRTVTGATSQRERDEIFPLFQRTDAVRVLNAHPACMAHGLTLTAADTVIWYGPITSLEMFEQANARIRRIGQKHKQQVLMLQSTPAERRIYSLLRAKQKVQDTILELFALNS